MATEHFINWVERRADQLRSKCSLTAFARLNPFDLAAKMQVPIFKPCDVPGLDPTVLDHVLTAGSHEWDAATIPLPGGKHVVVMNPTKCLERQHASLMEEIAHIYLEHKPSKLRTVNGIVLREWKKTHETQAFWVGAAALVPRRVMKGAITRQINLIELARQCGVSQDLIMFRERTLGLKILRPTLVGPS